jgi:hypothetical protein
MVTEGGEAWRTRSDTAAQQKGVGVLIDTEYLASANEDRSKNPYYIVVNGVRYYGSTPEAAVEAAKMHPDVKGTLQGEAVFMAQKQVSTAIASNRNRGSTLRNRAAAAAGSAKNAMGRGLNATRKFFTREPKASGAEAPAANTASAPAKKGFFARAANSVRGMTGRAKGYNKLNTAKPPAGSPATGPSANLPPAKAPEGINQVSFAGQTKENNNTKPLMSNMQGGAQKGRKATRRAKQRR